MRESGVLPIGCCLALAWNLGGPPACAETAPAKPSPEILVPGDLPRFPAVEPPDAVGTWRVKPGFRLELAAHEPHVSDPVAVSFDENGRMFVCEMIDYPENRDRMPHLGRISLLEDGDGDGCYEKATVFAEDLAWPTGLICANGGVHVIATPDILFLKDADGDGRAEVRETVFTGLGTGLAKLNVQGLANSPQWGLDQRIHIQCGGGNRGQIRCLKRPDLPGVELGGRDLWFDPRTFDFGLEAGGGQYGMSFDAAGHRFVCSNSDHLQYFVTDDRYPMAHPLVDFPTVRQSVAEDGGAAEVFRLSPDEPWRIVRTRWRVGGVVKGIVEGGGRVSGYFTGATGTTVYQGDAYGPGFVGNTFTGDAGGQLVHRKVIAENGASVLGKRPDDEKDIEFAASRDTWVRVVNFANAPDGCLHVIDMYREVIEHPWSLPDGIKRHLDLNNGSTRGRIYRIAPDRADWKRRASAKLGPLPTAGLVALLEHPNGWHRETAARLIHERNDPAAIPLLETMALSSTAVPGRLHALTTLAGFGAVGETVLLTALKDPAPAVREWALKLSEPTPDGSPVARAARKSLADENLHVRLQAMLSASLRPPSPGDDDAIGHALTSPGGTDDWIESAAALFDATTLLKVIRQPSLEARASALDRLAASIAATGDDTTRAQLVRWISDSDRRHRLLKPTLAGLRKAGVKTAAPPFNADLHRIFRSAALKATDRSAAVDGRVEATSLLAYAPFSIAETPLASCLGPDALPAVQEAAIAALGSFSNDRVPAALIDHWPAFSEAPRAAAIRVLQNRSGWTKALLEALHTRRLDGASLGPSVLNSLASHPDEAIAAHARSVLAPWLPPPRATVLATFRNAIEKPGNAASGRNVFRQRCLSCHRAAGEGAAVGPDLVTVKSKGRDALLLAILDPQREVATAFITYQIATRDGQSFAGIVKRDDATGMTLLMPGGAEKTLPRAAIQSVTSAGQGLMPVGLEAGLSVNDIADLLAFIETLN